MSTTVRRDLFAVQELDRTTVNAWCVVGICRTKETAVEHARDVRKNRSLGIIRQSRVIHPRQYVVDVWSASGQRIDD